MSKKDSTLIRVYVYETKVLFLDTANLPLGVPIGVIIQTDDDDWSFFPARALGLSLFELREISLKIAVLNETRKSQPDET